ncbi:baseplate assembly protein [Sulfurimonas sp.]|uniref:baseplate assembly protein n=1 Tax=Sulfurimonas sp. TaxID=2022749 RepID=UPI0025D3143B|nr:baseplate assembly protein [Sulfurimonas sp.]
MMKSIYLNSSSNTKFFSASEQESFNRILSTNLGSRVVRPYFGSELYTLIDGNMDDEWRLKFKKFTLEAFYDENHIPWDKRLNPSGVNITKLNATKNEVYTSIDFDKYSVETLMGGF